MKPQTSLCLMLFERRDISRQTVCRARVTLQSSPRRNNKGLSGRAAVRPVQKEGCLCPPCVFSFPVNILHFSGLFCVIQRYYDRVPISAQSLLFIFILKITSYLKTLTLKVQSVSAKIICLKKRFISAISVPELE